MQILLVTRLVLVYVCNILLLAQPANESNTTFYRMFSLKDPFCIIAVVNFSLSLLYFIIFLLKDVPLILSTSETKLRQGIESFKNYSIYNFYIQKAILCFKLIFHPIFLYNVASMVLLSLTFYNKLFVAILSLDILIQVKPLSSIFAT